ncbi:MAG: sensor histidine kinase [Thermodesulfobacteriota bacterium]
MVLLITGQQEFVQTEVEQGKIAAAMIGARCRNRNSSDMLAMASGDREELAAVFLRYGYSSVIVRDGAGREITVADRKKSDRQPIRKLMQKSLQANQPMSRLVGDTWGVFWRQEQAILMAVPVHFGDQTTAAAGFVFPLDSYYERLRHSQKFVLLYILTNAVLLALIGLYRMVQLLLKPVHRLVKKAEEYRDERNFTFFYEKEENEIGALSKALNRMMARISDDKHSLQTSLASLEKSNVELRKVRREIILAEKLASVGRLAAGIAHEIGNPIGIVLGYLGLLKHESISPEERQDFIERSEKEITRINTIIRQLLDFSRPGTDALTTVSVHPIIEEVAALLKVQPLLAKSRIELALTAERDRVLMDPNQLRQILINLLLNAGDAILAKQSPAGGWIRIETENTDGGSGKSELTIRLIDNGIGIPEGCQQNIFDPFFSTKEPGKGTGLGLSVCFMILEQIGGAIQACNSDTGGTTIVVSLPLNEKADPGIPSEQETIHP